MEVDHNPTTMALLLALLVSITKAQMVTQCVTNGTEVQLNCSLEDLEDAVYVSWYFPESNWDFGDDIYGQGSLSFIATWSDIDDVIQEISCNFVIDGGKFYYHSVLVPGDHNSTLPISPILTKGDNNTLSLTWNNTRTSFKDDDDVYFNYTVGINITGGNQYNQTYAVEAHETPHIILHLSECQHFDISISLPGNCEDKKISGSMPTVPEHFQHNVTSDVLFSGKVLAQQVQIRFTPPKLCISQEASYILSFDDGNETWSTEPEPIPDSSQQVLESIDLEENTEFRLKRGRNYTVIITVITEYANVTSTTFFSTHSGPINLENRGYSLGSVEVVWQNPQYFAYSFNYTIDATLLNSESVVEPFKVSFLPDEDTFISIDLNGFECEQIQITVAVLGAEEEAKSITVIVPSYSTKFIEDVHIDTLLNEDGTIREVEIEFKPPLVCKFQSSSYILTVSDGNEIIWSNSRDPVGITDPNQQVKVEIESGLEVNTEYNATVTVFTPYANISSSATFRFQLLPVATPSLDDSSGVTIVAGIVGGVVVLLVVVLFCGIAAGVVAVYVLKRMKRNKQKKEVSSVQKIMVINPLYGGSDGLYEEIPVNAATITKMTTAPSSVSVQPNLPPPRKHVDPIDLTKIERDDKLAGTLSSINNDYSISTSRQYDETEDGYTVMRPAGTLNMLPCNCHSTASLGGSVSLPMDQAP